MLRRSRQPRLDSVPLPALIAELRRRGYEALPIDALASFDTQQERERTGVDAAPVVAQLAELASVTLPETVAYARQLGDENTELRRRTARAEQDVDVLVAAAVGVITGEDESETNG